MRAMVIDDSRAIRLILTRQLQELGFDVSAAANGREALDCLAQGDPPALILVDWNMPVMDGYEFVLAVRKERRYDDVRLMMVTTETEMAQVQKAIAAGANEYMMKPFTKEAVREKLGLLGLAP